MSNYQLDHETLERIFTEIILPRYLHNQIPQKDTLQGVAPVFASVGGAPGSGKGHVLSQLKRELTGSVVVNGDELRQFHPDYEDLMNTDPLLMPRATAQASGAWVGMSTAYLRDRGISAIVETTLRDATMLQDEFNSFKEAGFTTRLQVLAVPPALSQLGTVTRYLRQIQDYGHGRWTPSTAHQQAAANMPRTLMALATSSTVDRIVIQTRDKRLLFDSGIMTPDQRATHAVTALQKAMELQAITPAQARQFLTDLHQAKQACKILKQSDPELVNTLNELTTHAAPKISALHSLTPHLTAQRQNPHLER